MVIVETVALAIMVSNDIVMPLVLKRRDRRAGEPHDAGAQLVDHAPHRDLRHPVARLHLLPFGRRGAARRDRAVVVRGGGAAGAGIFRRTGLAARHRVGRHRRHERRHPGLGLHAVAAEHFRSRHRRRAHPDRRAVGARLAAAAGAVRHRPAAAGAWRAVQPRRQYRLLYRLLARPPSDGDRAGAGGSVRAVVAQADRAELSAAPRLGRRSRS